MDITRLSIIGLESGGERVVRIRYNPYALFDLRADGLHRWTGIDTALPFIGENMAVKVLRQKCSLYPQNHWDSDKSLKELALGGSVVMMLGASYLIYIYDNTPYIIASRTGDSVHAQTIARLTDHGLELCDGISAKLGIARQDDVDAVRVWRVK